jgi:hypothetical protein
MTVPSQVNAAEMREALQLNFNSSFFWKVARGNYRVLVYGVVLAALLTHEIARGGSADWQKVALLAGAVTVFILLFLFRTHRIIAKTAKTLSASCNSLTIDSQGITAEAPNGTRTIVPWSAISRWREGKLVFTIGDAKTFRTVPKGSLGEMQSGELRSLLLSQVPTR